MKMKRISNIQITILALSAAMNIIGGQIALLLKLPIYFDMLGTIFTAAVLGPFYGALPGIASGIILGVSTDIYSLYYMPVQIITGIAAGCIFKTKWMEKWRLFLGTLAVTIPGTIVSASITAYLFGGLTSSGSSFLVMLLRKWGFHEIASVFAVQIATDYLDRIIMAGIAAVLIKALPKAYYTQNEGK